MSKRRAKSEDTLFKDAEELLSHVEEAQRLVADLPEQTVADINSQVRLNDLDSLNRGFGLQVDARVETHVSIDDMLSTADFYPPVAGGKSLDVAEIEELLTAKNIVYGVIWENIRDAVFRCNTDGVEIEGVVIAKGREPIAELPERLVIESRFFEPAASPTSESGRVEHKERSPFVLVEKDELLAKRVLRQAGEEGCTVHGKVLAAPKVARQSLVPGANTYEGPDGVYAACAGRLVLDRDGFFVTPVLDVPGDVDYSTGHLDFDGDIIIRGDVKDGFNVKATGSIHCQKTLSATQVDCGGDLIIGRGIIGRHKGEVRVGGSIRCKYIEHCHVEAKGSITAIVGAMNSVINTNQRFETGPRGIVVGGKLFAQDGVTVTQLGTSMGPATEVYCGIDHSVLARLEWIRDRNMELATKLSQVRSTIRTKGDSSDRLARLEEKLSAAVKKLNSASVSLVGHLDKNEEAVVVVRETVFPNTYVEICNASFVVISPIHGVAFKLDRERGKVVHVPLS